VTALRAVVVAAFLGVLSVIAFDLHRVATALVSLTGVSASAKQETLAEHDARLRAELKLFDHDADIILEPVTKRPAHAAAPKSK